MHSKVIFLLSRIYLVNCPRFGPGA
jgi:hypothetical protein